MRRLLNERNLLLGLSLLIATTLWYYVGASRNPPLARTTSKSVAVVPMIVGEPAYGYSLLGIRVTPQAITVSGDPVQLQSVHTVTTEAVNITGAIRDVFQEVGVVGPPDLSVSGRVRVAVQVAPAIGVTVVRGIRVQVRNAPPGVVAQIEPQTVQVQVQGPITVVSRLRADDFRARVDGDDFGEGRRRVRIVIEAPPQVEVLAITPPAVTLTVRRGG